MIQLEDFQIMTPILILITYLSSFESGKPTCKRYLLNVMLYLLTSFSLFKAILTIPSISIFEKTKGTILLSFILISSIYGFYNSSVLIKHIYLFIIISSLAYLTRYLYNSYDSEDYVFSSILLFYIILLLAIGYYIYPSLFDSENKYIISLLLIILLFIGDYLYSKKRYHILSYSIVFLFVLWFVYDTKYLLKDSQLCSSYPDYPQRLIDFFFNINIIKDIFR